MKRTDERSIAKQIVSGLCWSPVVAIGLCVAAFLGLVIYGIVIAILNGGFIKLVTSVLEGLGIVVLVFGYFIAFVWSNKK